MRELKPNLLQGPTAKPLPGWRCAGGSRGFFSVEGGERFPRELPDSVPEPVASRWYWWSSARSKGLACRGGRGVAVKNWRRKNVPHSFLPYGSHWKSQPLGRLQHDPQMR